jgi:hypothetical protein
MNDLLWKRKGHDHGAVTGARSWATTPVYLRYNRRPQHLTNGQEFARQLESVVQRWPVPETELVLIGHSNGRAGRAQAPAYYGEVANHAWTAHLSKVLFLGTPHHGAPLERGGNWVDVLLGATAYSCSTWPGWERSARRYHGPSLREFA